MVKVDMTKEFMISDNICSEDFAVLYGFSLFETFLVNGSGRVFLLDHHIERLFSSMEYFNFRVDSEKQDFINIILKHIEENSAKNMIMRITVSFGNRLKDVKPQVMISLRENTLKPEDYLKGLRLTVSSLKKSEDSYIIRHKTANYLDNYLVAQKALTDGFYDAIFQNSKGNITETTKCNVFFVRDNIIHTPALKCGLLPGIIRNWIISKATLLGIEVQEGEYLLEDLKEADEVFLTNSVVGLMGVCSIDNSAIRQGPLGPVTKRLHDEYIREYF